MSFEQTVLLAALRGVTVFLGLPVGRLRNLSTRAQAILTAAAGGIILFLLWDILSQAVDPVEAALEAARSGQGPTADFITNAAALAFSLVVGLMSVVFVTQRMRRGATGPSTARQLALGTAVGLGLHNFSEGLAIGQSSAIGETTLALLLVVGFAAHNATEGFGIAAPLTSGERPTWAFLATLGVIGGGPTFLGGVLGYSLVSPLLSITFLGLAAGALIYVFVEMMSVSRKLATPMATYGALLVGMLIAFATDFVLVAAGA